MKISFNLTPSSIRGALQTIRNVKQQLVKDMQEDFFQKCFQFFVERANMYVDLVDIGSNVKQAIKDGWRYEKTLLGVSFVNTHEQATFVEFGVGDKGGEKPHPSSSLYSNNYQYGVGEKIFPDGSWIFNPHSDADIDIDEKSILVRTEHTVRTKGSPAVMYAYQALDDLRNAMPKIWEDIKIKYWG